MEEDKHGPRQRPVRFMPPDILHDILLCLPARTLLTFRFACKSWLSSITDPAFISSHTERSANSPTTDLTIFKRYPQNLYIYNHRSRTYKTLLLNDLLYPNCSNIDPTSQFVDYEVASVNGLLLLSSHKTIYVCNPCTREIVTLPPVHFNPYTVGTEFGFGVDPSTGKYKVLLFARTGRTGRYHVFTQGAQSWGRAETNLTNHFSRDMKYSVFFDGVIYWVTVTHRDHWVTSSDEDYSLVSFDLRDEEFALLPAPPLYHGDGYRHVEQLQGNLCLVDCFKGNYAFWVMKKPEQKWIKSYNLKIQIPKAFSPHRYSRFIMITEENYFWIATMIGVFGYNQTSNKLTLLFTSEPTREYKDAAIYMAGRYTETLAPAS